MEKIYLGRSKEWGNVYLTKHEWQCGWYWAFGYLGNRDCHFHIDSLIDHPEQYDRKWTDVSRHFETTWISQDQWWVIRDLFISAYALKNAAENYRHGGHQTGKAAPFRIVNPEMAVAINKDLETLLGNIWKYVSEGYSASKAV